MDRHSRDTVRWTELSVARSDGRTGIVFDAARRTDGHSCETVRRTLQTRVMTLSDGRDRHSL